MYFFKKQTMSIPNTRVGVPQWGGRGCRGTWGGPPTCVPSLGIGETGYILGTKTKRVIKWKP